MSLHAMSRSLALVMLLLAVSCGKGEEAAFAPDPQSPVAPFAVVVSNVIGSSGPGVAGSTVGDGIARSMLDGPVVYVSLLPGAIPHGATVAVRNLNNGAETAAAIIDGGADPVPVAALEGETLRIVATDSAGASYTCITLVKRRASPRVVRTDPLPAKTDVPLNSIIRLVFSEPVDLPTVESGVHLRQASGPVAGAVRPVDGSPAVITFVPDSPLAPGTDYTLEIGAGVLDLDGDSLLAAVTVPFTTSGSASPAAPPTVPPTVPPSGTGVARLRVVHAVAGVGDMDLIVSGRVVVSDLPYLAATGYLDVTAGSHDVRFQVQGGTMFSFRKDLPAGAEYTALPCCRLMPNGNLLTDDNSEPPAGQARIRFVDYASFSASVKIYLTSPGADLASAIPIRVDVTWASDYYTVPAGDYQVRVTPFDSDVVALDSGPLALVAGQVRTIVTVDAPAGGAPYGFLILPDRN